MHLWYKFDNSMMTWWRVMAPNGELIDFKVNLTLKVKVIQPQNLISS